MNRRYAHPKSPRLVLCLTALAFLLAVGGCTGITADGRMPDSREEGPESGLFSGPDGEFIIFAPAPSADRNFSRH